MEVFVFAQRFSPQYCQHICVQTLKIRSQCILNIEALSYGTELPLGVLRTRISMKEKFLLFSYFGGRKFYLFLFLADCHSYFPTFWVPFLTWHPALISFLFWWLPPPQVSSLKSPLLVTGFSPYFVSSTKHSYAATFKLLEMIIKSLFRHGDV